MPANQDADPPPKHGASCQNCGEPLAGEYCHHCGQRQVPTIGLRYLVRRFFESALDLEDLEHGLQQTFVGAARNPGRVARRYVQGERKQFVNPIGYFLLTATITFLIFLAFRETWVEGQVRIYESMWRSMGTDPAQVFRADSPLRSTFGWASSRDLAASMFNWFQQLQTYVGLLTCVLAGLLLRGMVSTHTLAELLVFELYVMAEATLALGLLSPLCFWGAPALIGILPIALQTGFHAHGGGAFFGPTGKGRLLPVAAYVASTALLLVGSTILSAGLLFYVA